MRQVAPILQVELLSWKSSKDISNDGGGSLGVQPLLGILPSPALPAASRACSMRIQVPHLSHSLLRGY